MADWPPESGRRLGRSQQLQLYFFTIAPLAI